MAACPEPETLALMLEEKLLSPLRDQVEAHVEECEACQEELDRLSRDAPPVRANQPRKAPAPGKFLATDSFLARIGNRNAPHPLWRPLAPGGAWPRVDSYEIIGELGSGGMGRVYRARHLGLGRQVALKVIKPGPSAELLRGRLEQEAMALARLRHPNIVQVYDVGESDGQAFLALELVEGTTLSAWLNGLPQPPTIAAHLVWVLAQAVDYAHRNGILHRDLKPANILVETSPDDPPALSSKATPPRIKITDFGLAKAIAEGDPLAAGLTMTGDVIGTPQYMAPEQGSGIRGSIGPGVDVYALGVILYELLVGHPPFRGETPLKTIMRVVHEAPPNLSRLRPEVPSDLATICMKCLEKSPSKRYASAGAMAEDLRRFLSREPIAARPVGPVGRLTRWGQRKPWLAAMAGAMIGSGTLAFGLVFWQWRTAEAARARAEMAHLESERLAVELLLDESLAACERGEIPAGLEGLARTRWKAKGLGLGSLAEICRANIACWSSRWTVISKSPLLGPIVTVAYSPDGRRLLSVQRAASGKEAGRAIATLWDPEGWKPIGRPLVHEGSITSVAFSPDGRLILTGSDDGTVRLWDAATTEPAGPELRELRSVATVAFHPNSKLFVAGGERSPPYLRGCLCFWEMAEDGKIAAKTHAFTGPVDAIAFSPDGALVATASRLPETSFVSANAEIYQWTVATKERASPQLMHATAVRALAYSPDSKLIATGGDERVAILWDRKTGERVKPPLRHPVGIKSIAFSPDGKTLAVVGGELGPDGAADPSARRESCARFWDVETGKLHAGLIAEGMVQAISFGQGRQLAIAGRDGHVHVANAHLNPATRRVLPFSCNSLAFSPDARLLIVAGQDRESAGGRSQALDPATGEPLRPPIQHPSKVRTIAIARGENVYAVTLEDGTVRAYDAQTDQPLGPPLDHPGAVESLRFAPDGKRLLTTVPGSTSRLWDWSRGEIAWSTPPEDPPRIAALSPDGRRVLVAREGGGLALWDLSNGRPAEETWPGPSELFVSAGFSSDGRFVLVGDDKGVARCWELATGAVTETEFNKAGSDAVAWVGFVGAGSGAYAIDAHPTSGLGLIHAWDPLSGHPPKQLRYRANFRAITLDPGRKFLATGGWIGGARLWDAATGHQIGPELFSAWNVIAIACSPDGRSVAAIDEKNALSTWRIPLPDPESPAE